MGKRPLIEITSQNIRDAEDYVPLFLKAAASAALAPLCVKRYELDGVLSFGVDNVMRERAVLGLLVKYYLKLPFGDGTEVMMSPDEYDLYAGSHLINALERMKSSDTGLRDKIHEIKDDYYRFVRFLDSEIDAQIRARNDTLARINAFFTESGFVEKLKESTDRAIEEAKGSEDDTADVSVQEGR